MKRVLVIEDETLLRALLCEEVADLGYAVSSAVNGREGLKAVARTRPHLVLCDNAMPVMSGLEFVRALHARDGAHAPPVIMVSAFGSAADMAAAHEAGIVAYCTKPLDFDRLAALIEATV